MKKNDLIKLLTDCGFDDNLASTQLHKYTIPRNGRNSFNTNSLDNRSNTPWGRGEYIIVPYEHNSTVDTETLINNWKILARQDQNQYLILGVDDDNWELYDYNGELLGGNQEIQVRFGKSNNQEIILREKKAATFYKKAMRLTIDFDPNLEKMQNSFKLSRSGDFLNIGDNNFSIGCNTNHSIRENDIDKSIIWNHQEKDYNLYLEHTLESIKDDFAPEYNKCYASFFKIDYDTSSKEFCLIKYHQNASENYNSYLAAIRTKPFILLAGISGTGKSRVVRRLAQASVTEELQSMYDPTSVKNNFEQNRWNLHKPANFELIQVKPNWHNSMEVIGYKSNINGAHYEFTPFIEFVARAWQHQNVPFFLCLDEMNLAPVEQYFAEFLSAIESRTLENDEYMTDPIIKPFESFGKNVCDQMLDTLLPKVPASAMGTPSAAWIEKLKTHFKTKGLTLPKNLIVMGTVNMDETTFSFSRKVLDRAMSIVMNEVNLEAYFNHQSDVISKVLDEKNCKLMIDRPISGLEVVRSLGGDSQIVRNYFETVNKRLEGTPFKLGYRAISEALLYASAAKDFGNVDINDTLDQFTMMKILSRIEGDKRSIGSLLINLQEVITDKYDKSHKKLKLMAETLEHAQFVSYWT